MSISLGSGLKLSTAGLRHLPFVLGTEVVNEGDEGSFVFTTQSEVLSGQ